MKRINILILTLLFFSSASLIAQDASSVNNSGKADETVAVGPKVSWDTMIFDMGEVKFNTKTKAEFTLTNAGNEPLLITYAKTSCGCTDLEYSEAPILPGRATKISAIYDGTGDGEFMKTITVMTNANAEEKTTLQIKGKVVRR